MADPAAFPPFGPTSTLKIVPSYLYVQYADDDDLQATRRAFNQLAQALLDWFNETPLGVYTSDAITGDLLDWVAAGLYGMTRPSLVTGHKHAIGPFNTYVTNTRPFNYFLVVGDAPPVDTTDDTFKRILTWAIWKGDGKTFSVRWLKRRIARFLTGTNGTAGQTDQTYNISVTFGAGNDVHIDITTHALILKEAIDSGTLELPFQFNFIVTTA